MFVKEHEDYIYWIDRQIPTPEKMSYWIWGSSDSAIPTLPKFSRLAFNEAMACAVLPNFRNFGSTKAKRLLPIHLGLISVSTSRYMSSSGLTLKTIDLANLYGYLTNRRDQGTLKKVKVLILSSVPSSLFSEGTINICRFNPWRTFLHSLNYLGAQEFNLEFEYLDQGPWFAYDPFMALWVAMMR